MKPLDDLSDEELEARRLAIQRRRKGVQPSTETGMTMEDVMGTEWTCDYCRPRLAGGRVQVVLLPGDRCSNCGRVG